MVSKKKKYNVQVGLRLPHNLLRVVDKMVKENAVFRSRSHFIYLAISEYCANRMKVGSVEEFHALINKQSRKRGGKQNELDL